MSGLLGYALAGGIANAGNTGAAMMLKKMEMDRQTERDNALSLREENLARLRQELSDESDVKKSDLAQNAKIDEENRAEDRLNETPNDKFRLKKADGSTVIPTNQQIKENQADNSAVAYFDNKSKAAEDAKIAEFQKKGGLIATANIDAVRKAGELSPEDKEIRDSYDAAGKLTTYSEDAAAAANALKEEALNIREKTLAQQFEFKAKTLELQAGMTQAKIDHLRSLGEKGSADEIKLLESQRKSADSAYKILKNAEDAGREMTPEETKLYNKHIIASGAPDDVMPILAPPVKPPKEKGTWDKLKGVFSKEEPAKAASPRFVIKSVK